MEVVEDDEYEDRHSQRDIDVCRGYPQNLAQQQVFQVHAEAVGCGEQRDAKGEEPCEQDADGRVLTKAGATGQVANRDRYSDTHGGRSGEGAHTDEQCCDNPR